MNLIAHIKTQIHKCILLLKLIKMLPDSVTDEACQYVSSTWGFSPHAFMSSPFPATPGIWSPLANRAHHWDWHRRGTGTSISLWLLKTRRMITDLGSYLKGYWLLQTNVAHRHNTISILTVPHWGPHRGCHGHWERFDSLSSYLVLLHGSGCLFH